MISQAGLTVWIMLALALMVVQFFLTPGYGRHRSSRWGPAVPNQLGWVLMEAVALLSLWLGWYLAQGNRHGMDSDGSDTVAALAMGLWTLHYVHRAFVYPLRTQTRGKFIPLAIMLAAMAFNLVNGWLNGTALGAGQIQNGAAEPLSLHTVSGLILFLVGAGINIHADNTLLGLRRERDRGYHIPRGGLFEYVSCPNFFGEMVQWAGFALLCWNLPALAFAIWTAANLVPRGVAHHRWYRTQFADYPPDRRALIPGVL